MLQLMVNTSELRRVWTLLENADTHRTLGLDPGEEANVDVPDGFEDPYLQPVQGARTPPQPQAAIVAPAPPASPTAAASALNEGE